MQLRLHLRNLIAPHFLAPRIVLVTPLASILTFLCILLNIMNNTTPTAAITAATAARTRIPDFAPAERPCVLGVEEGVYVTVAVDVVQIVEEGW